MLYVAKVGADACVDPAVTPCVSCLELKFLLRVQEQSWDTAQDHRGRTLSLFTGLLCVCLYSVGAPMYWWAQRYISGGLQVLFIPWVLSTFFFSCKEEWCTLFCCSGTHHAGYPSWPVSQIDYLSTFPAVRFQVRSAATPSCLLACLLAFETGSHSIDQASLELSAIHRPLPPEFEHCHFQPHPASLCEF